MELVVYQNQKNTYVITSMQKKGSSNTALKAMHPSELILPKTEQRQLSPTLSCAEMKKVFVERLRTMPTEERYLAVKIHSPELVLSFRKAFRRVQFENNPEHSSHKNQGLDSRRFPPKMVKAFFEGIVLMSDDDYLDSVGFDFNLIESPQKLFDFLFSFLNEKQSETTLKDFTVYKEALEDLAFSMGKASTKQELGILFSKALRQQVILQILKYQENQRLQDERTRKKDFTMAWKNCSEEAKIKMLYLGKSDCKEMVRQLFDRMSLIPSSQELEKEIIELLKADKNQICNKVFKSRLKKNHILLQDYHEMLYQTWRSEVQKKKKRKPSQRTKKRRHEPNLRNKSVSVQSNQTNQTQYRQEVLIDVEELIRLKINRDISDYSDQISNEANFFYNRRVEAFNRIQYLFQTYYQTELHLFGSCACGLAVKNSDIDVAIDDRILDYFQYVPENKRVSAALEYLAQGLESRPWITKLKLINTAAIPIINLTIDTSIPMCEYFMNENDYYRFNSSQNQGEIDVDLTIKMSKESYGPIHLGIPSTLFLKDWLQDIQKLQQITIILKYYLSVKSLNNTYSGGLKTYSLVVMIIAYIKHHKLQNSGALEAIMGGLTHFYGFEFDQNNYGIDITDKFAVFYKKQQRCDSNSAALEIRDPINGKIMTRSCYSFHQIKKMMRIIHQVCFQKTKMQIQEYCSSLNPKTRRLATHQVLHQFNETFPNNNFSTIVGN